MRYLVVGLGNVGRKRECALGARCVATVDPWEANAKYTSHLDVPDNIYDSVVLATPNNTKLDYLTHFLSRGKNVLVEKTLLFPDAKVASDLHALASRSGAVWYTSYNHRFEPHIRAVKELLEAQFVGSVYWARLVYGNGTVQNILGSWRDGGYGVLEDMGSHLVDLTHFLMGYEESNFRLWDLKKCEAKSFDHCVFSTFDNKVFLECSWLMWKNTFTIDVFGNRGSIHMRGLCKWGSTELVTRKRVVPSGVPEENRVVLDAPDRTWEYDLDEFERRVRDGQSSGVDDMRISRAIHGLVREEESTCLT